MKRKERKERKKERKKERMKERKESNDYIFIGYSSMSSA
jgi:hypothetical protein